MLLSFLLLLVMRRGPATFSFCCAGNPHSLGRGYSTLEFAMNIEIEEVVVQDVADDALEQAAGGAQGGNGGNGGVGGVLTFYPCIG